MYALDLPTGSLIWQTQLGFTSIYCGKIKGPGGGGSYFGITGTPVFDRSKDALYSMGGNGTFYALSMKNGAILWSIPNAYDPAIYVSYSALLLYNDIIYTPFAFHCDQFNGNKGKIVVISAVTRSIINIFYASGSDAGGGMWGMGGAAMSIGATPASSYVYIDTGNCNKNAAYGYCESIVKLDTNGNLVSYYQAPDNLFAGDNDFGAPITVFNHPSEGQTSGCKKTLVASARKDATLFVTDDQTNLVQSINIGDPTTNIAYLAGGSWDPSSNTFMIGNYNAWTDSAGVTHSRGIHGFRLGSNCQLTEVWYAPILTAGVYFIHGTIVGPPGQRFLIRNEGALTAIDVQTGNIVTKLSQNLLGPAPVSAAGGYVVAVKNGGQSINAFKMY